MTRLASALFGHDAAQLLEPALENVTYIEALPSTCKHHAAA